MGRATWTVKLRQLRESRETNESVSQSKLESRKLASVFFSACGISFACVQDDKST